MRNRRTGEGVLRVKLSTASLAVALAMADARRQTLDEYFQGLIQQDAQSLARRVGAEVEWREQTQEAHDDNAN